jgi:hypothetical protein
VRAKGTCLVAVAALGAAACGSGASPPVSRLYGEVHLHEFPGGTHPGALFVDEPVARATVRGDSVLPPTMAPSARAGACELVESGAACPAPCRPPAFADAGRVRIDGTRVPVELALDRESASYLPTVPLAAGTLLFDGGEELIVRGDGAGAPGFAGEVRAPMPLTLRGPMPLTAADGVLVSWAPDRSTAITITLVASTTDGRFAIVTCGAADADGALRVPDELIARLPAPPRDLQLQVSRDQIAYAPATVAGEGVVLHAGYAVTESAHEDPR